MVQPVIYDGTQIVHAIRQQLLGVRNPPGDSLNQRDFGVTSVPRLAGTDSVGLPCDERRPPVALGRPVQALGQVADSLLFSRQQSVAVRTRKRRRGAVGVLMAYPPFVPPASSATLASLRLCRIATPVPSTGLMLAPTAERGARRRSPGRVSDPWHPSGSLPPLPAQPLRTPSPAFRRSPGCD